MPTADGCTPTVLSSIIPVASSFTQSYHAGGTASTGLDATTDDLTAAIGADATDGGRLVLKFPASTSGNPITFHFTVTYQIL